VRRTVSPWIKVVIAWYISKLMKDVSTSNSVSIILDILKRSDCLVQVVLMIATILISGASAFDAMIGSCCSSAPTETMIYRWVRWFHYQIG